jgi:hypothetical protein
VADASLIETLRNRPAPVVTELSNGAQVALIENHQAPVVAVRVYVRTGSMHERELLGAGVSHLLEHLVSGGTTPTRTEAQSRDMLDAMGSQVYEWLPWLAGTLDSVPEDEAGRREWLKETWNPRFLMPAKAWRGALAKRYGKKTAAKIRYAECFELCEYGRQPAAREIKELFPFFPKRRV